MHSLNIVLTRQYIFYQSPDLPLDDTILDTIDISSDRLSHFDELLSELALPRSTSLNVVLDNSYISYFYFSLPPVNKRKLDKILQYELADVLIEDIDQFFYDLRFKNRKENTAQLGIFLLKKDIVHQLLQICKTHGLEIKSILSLDDLIDLQLREKYRPDNEIIVTADRYNAQLIVYKSGFAIDYSNQIIPGINDVETQPEDNIHTNKLSEINWKIKAIGLNELEIDRVRISDESKSYLSIVNENELATIPNDKNGVPTSICSNILSELQTSDRSKRINLLKSNFFVFQELKKHTKEIIVLAVLVSLIGIVYFTSLIYQNFKYKDQYLGLEKIYEETIKIYLPNHKATNTAFQTLKNQVNELKKQRAENQKFTKRDYQVSQQLSDISQLKKQLTGLVLTRFFITNQTIRIQGEVANFTEYDRLKASLQKIYPPGYSLRYNQKSTGEEKIEFTVTIREN